MTLHTMKKLNFYMAVPLKHIVFHYPGVSWKAQHLGAAQRWDVHVHVSNLIVLF